VSIEIANARAFTEHQLGERRIVLRQEELNPEPDFTALAFFQKAHSYLFKEWSLFVASDQNKAKSVSSPSIGYSGSSLFVDECGVSSKAGGAGEAGATTSGSAGAAAGAAGAGCAIG